MTLQLVIAPAAQHDLANIYRYSLTTWGQAQAETYMTQMEQNLWLLTAQPSIGKERNDLFPGVRSLPVNKHLVYYQHRQNQIHVARILHGRQDPNRHLPEY